MRVFRKLQMKSNMIFERTERYLFRSVSFGRSIILTISIVALFFISYLVIGKVYYAIAIRHSYILMSQQYFPIFFCIAMLPIFGFIFFKLNIWMTFWKNTEKPHLVDYLFFFVILLFLYVSFNHGDLTATSVHGKAFLDMTWRRMNLLDFYDYNQGKAVYLLPQYILFGIWSIPVKIGYMLAGLPPIGVNETSRINGLTLWWYKLLPTLFYAGSAYMIYKIGIFLQMDKNKAKWMAFVFLTFPMATFSQFIFGQYDSIGVFFELLMIYYFLKKRLLKASLVCMIAMTFKLFPFFIFLPLILLFEKGFFKIVWYCIIALSGYIFFNILFQNSPIFAQSTFYGGMLNRLFNTGVNINFGIISFFALTVIAACVFSYFTNIDNITDEFALGKYSLFIPLCVYSSFFSFVLYHPQWILILVPYLVLNIFINRNIKGFILIVIGVNLAYILATMSNILWFANVDANMIDLGIFHKLFGFSNVRGENFRSLIKFVSIPGLEMPMSPFCSLFVGLLLVNIILAFPNAKNIIVSRKVLKSSFIVERDMIWINGMIVLLFAIPSLLLFFTQGRPDSVEKRYLFFNYNVISIPLPNDIETLRQNVYDIDSIEIINNDIILKCRTGDPWLYISLQSGIEKPFGCPIFEITYTNSKAGSLRIYFNYDGEGLSEERSSAMVISAVNNETTVRLGINGWEYGKQLVGFRIDPPDGTEFVIKSIRILSIE